MAAGRLVIGLVLGLLVITPALVLGSRAAGGRAAAWGAGQQSLHHQERSRGTHPNLPSAIIADVTSLAPVLSARSPHQRLRARPGLVSSSIFVPPRS